MDDLNSKKESHNELSKRELLAMHFLNAVILRNTNYNDKKSEVGDAFLYADLFIKRSEQK